MPRRLRTEFWCQLPYPDHIDSNPVDCRNRPNKDVDGLTEVSAGRLLLGKAGLRPCTPRVGVILAKELGRPNRQTLLS